MPQVPGVGILRIDLHLTARADHRIPKLARTVADLAGALSAYRASLAIAARLAAADPTNAGWQRDLWVSCSRVADVAERSGEPGAAQWWERADRVLSAMKRAGMYVSAADEGFHRHSRQKLGKP